MSEPTGNIRVLIVDDEPIIRDALSALLEIEPDIDVVGVATNAQEAIAMVELLEPTVTVLDVRLPGGGGEHVAHELQRIAPETKLLAFSAYGDHDSIATMRALGVAAYLVKGAPNQDVVESIRTLAGL
jgi:DNA-binding NarL/FixJ family response regulator